MGNFVVLVLERGTRQVLERITKGLVQKLARHPPVRCYVATFIVNIEHQVGRPFFLFGLISSHFLHFQTFLEPNGAP